MDQLKKRAVALLLLFCILHVCRAVICESFTDQATCERTMTSEGGCKWIPPPSNPDGSLVISGSSGACVHDPTKILPAGMAGITSIGNPQIVMDLGGGGSVPGNE